jgi:endonuclease/exonuclease/phosphatase family metal-dependent hydrolase
MELRVLTLNTHKGFAWLNRRFVLHELRKAIRSTDPDIVFLQEVVGRHVKKARRYAGWPSGTQYEFLAEEVWAEYAYGRNAIYPDGHHGNAVLSKYPIHHSGKVDISTNRFEQRGLLHCVVGLPGLHRPLHCICLHLGLFSRSRRKQVTMLRGFVTNHIPPDAPLIVAGDFNDWQGAHKGEFWTSLGLTDVAVETGGAMARTFPSWLPVLPLDRIYCRGLTVRSSEICHKGVWARLSDHAALVAEVTLAA